MASKSKIVLIALLIGVLALSGCFSFGGGSKKETSAPEFSPNPDDSPFDSPLSVTLSSDTSGATIYYVINLPYTDADSFEYTGPITLYSNSTIRAIAYSDSLLPSDVVEARYVIGDDGTGGGNCIDNDGDGYGDGCSAGLDCDDYDSTVHSTRTCDYDGYFCGNYELCRASCPSKPSEQCSNNKDDDCDNFVDCDDSSCSSSSACGGGGSPCDTVQCNTNEYCDDSSGVAVCKPTGAGTVFNTGVWVEAENGILSGSMATKNDGGVVAVYSPETYEFGVDASSKGHASYTFEVPSTGDYILKVKVKAVDGGSDSFFVIKSTNSIQNPFNVYDAARNTVFIEDQVSLRGHQGTFDNAEFDPAKWYLSKGRHTIEFHARESNTLLDKVKLEKHSGTTPECTSDSQCSYGYECVNQVCVKTNTCSIDTDCGRGYECINHECVPFSTTECSNNQNCVDKHGAGWFCDIHGVCLDGGSSGECTADSYCINNYGPDYKCNSEGDCYYAGGGEPQSDLRLHLKFDNSYSDSSPYSHDVSCSGGACPSYTTGKLDRAAIFSDGDMVSVANVDAINSFDKFTLMAWIKPSAPGGLGGGRIISKPQEDISDDYMLTYEADGRIKARVRLEELSSTSKPYVNAYSSGKVAESTWTHVAATWDGSNIRIYINGNAQGTTSASGTLTDNGYPLTIGRHRTGYQNDGNNRQFYGLIDEVKVYSKAMSSSQIKEVMGSVNTDVCSGPAEGSNDPKVKEKISGLDDGNSYEYYDECASPGEKILLRHCTDTNSYGYGYSYFECDSLGAGYVCQDGACVNTEVCDPECGSGYECQSGSCVKLQCTGPTTIDRNVKESVTGWYNGNYVTKTDSCIGEDYADTGVHDYRCEGQNIVANTGGCSSGKVCADGKCVDKSNECSPACGSGYECQSGSCVKLQCTGPTTIDRNVKESVTGWYNGNYVTKTDSCIGEDYADTGVHDYRCEGQNIVANTGGCSSGKVCADGACVTEPTDSCTNAASCNGGQVCISGKCLDNPTASDAEYGRACTLNVGSVSGAVESGISVFKENGGTKCDTNTAAKFDYSTSANAITAKVTGTNLEAYNGYYDTCSHEDLEDSQFNGMRCDDNSLSNGFSANGYCYEGNCKDCSQNSHCPSSKPVCSSGTCVEGAQPTCTTVGGKRCLADTALSNAYTVVSEGNQYCTGTQNVCVKCSDSATWSSSSNTCETGSKTDTTDPNLGSLSPSGTTSDNTPTYTWSSSDSGSGIKDHTVGVYSGSTCYTGPNGNTKYYGQGITGKKVTQTNALEDGNYCLRVIAYDNAGNSKTVDSKFTVNTEVSYPKCTGELEGDGCTDSVGAGEYELSIGNDWCANNMGAKYDICVECGSGFAWEGGNVGDCVDVSKPSVSNLEPSQTVEDNTPTFTWSSSDNVGVEEHYIRVYVDDVCDGATYASQGDITGRTWTYSGETTIADGQHAFSVEAKDAAGNKATKCQKFTVDAPAVDPCSNVKCDVGEYCTNGDCKKVACDGPSQPNVNYKHTSDGWYNNQYQAKTDRCLEDDYHSPDQQEFYCSGAYIKDTYTSCGTGETCVNAKCAPTCTGLLNGAQGGCSDSVGTGEEFLGGSQSSTEHSQGYAYCKAHSSTYDNCVVCAKGYQWNPVDKDCDLIDTNEAPEADFEYAPLSPRENSNVNFDSTSTDDEGIKTHAWYIDGGSSSVNSDNTFSYKFTSAGKHSVKLVVVDDEGKSDWITKYVTVIEDVPDSCTKASDCGATEFCISGKCSTGCTEGDSRAGEKCSYNKGGITGYVTGVGTDPNNVAYGICVFTSTSSTAYRKCDTTGAAKADNGYIYDKCMNSAFDGNQCDKDELSGGFDKNGICHENSCQQCHIDNDCYGSNKICDDGTCIDDPCIDVTCKDHCGTGEEEGTYFKNGQCTVNKGEALCVWDEEPNSLTCKPKQTNCEDAFDCDNNQQCVGGKCKVTCEPNDASNSKGIVECSLLEKGDSGKTSLKKGICTYTSSAKSSAKCDTWNAAKTGSSYYDYCISGSNGWSCDANGLNPYSATGVCSSGKCSECHDAGDCSGNNKACSSGTCVECSTDSHCGSGRLCTDENKCIPDPCETHQCDPNKCDGTTWVYDGVCKINSQDNAYCSYSKEYDSFNCRAQIKTCSDAQDCEGEESNTMCVGGECKSGCSTSHTQYNSKSGSTTCSFIEQGDGSKTQLKKGICVMSSTTSSSTRCDTSLASASETTNGKYYDRCMDAAFNGDSCDKDSLSSGFGANGYCNALACAECYSNSQCGSSDKICSAGKCIEDPALTCGANNLCDEGKFCINEDCKSDCTMGSKCIEDKGSSTVTGICTVPAVGGRSCDGTLAARYRSTYYADCSKGAGAPDGSECDADGLSDGFKANGECSNYVCKKWATCTSDRNCNTKYGEECISGFCRSPGDIEA